MYLSMRNIPHKCHICHLLHMQMADHNIDMYTSYDLTAINNVAISTGKHAFLITDMDP